MCNLFLSVIYRSNAPTISSPPPAIPEKNEICITVSEFHRIIIMWHVPSAGRWFHRRHTVAGAHARPISIRCVSGLPLTWRTRPKDFGSNRTVLRVKINPRTKLTRLVCVFITHTVQYDNLMEITSIRRCRVYRTEKRATNTTYVIKLNSKSVAKSCTCSNRSLYFCFDIE